MLLGGAVVDFLTIDLAGPIFDDSLFSFWGRERLVDGTDPLFLEDIISCNFPDNLLSGV